MKRVLIYVSVIFAMFIFSDVKVAAYSDVCNESIIESDGVSYGVCDKNLIYLMRDNKDKSSYIVANRKANGNNVILYAGIIDGIDTFYARSFNFYGVVYDDRGIFTGKNDMWYDIYIDDIRVANGEFEDAFLFEQSKRGFHLPYNQEGTYIINQYIRREKVSSIRIIIENKKNFGINLNGAYIGGNDLSLKEIIYDSYDLSFNLSKGEYGHKNIAKISINGCYFEREYSSNVFIGKEELYACFLENKTNSVSLTVFNGFNESRTYSYSFKMLSKNVSVSLENNVSTPISTSARVLINAKAGAGKTLDENCSLYYWSMNADDKLTYDSFMTNYENSKLKGTYSGDRGVILREQEGSYYLYALAKDDDSYVVVRSEQFIMEKKELLNSIILSDIAVVLLLSALAATPVIIYMKVREEDTK